MEYVVCNKSDLDAIASSIRLKTGKADLLPIDAFIDELCSVQTFDNIIDGTITEFSNSNLTEICTGMFQNCHYLRRVYVPNVTRIKSTGFGYCYLLTEANFPLVTSVSGDCFYECTSLTTANFPLLSEVHSDCFYGCTALTSINFPSLKTIGMNVFEKCSSLHKCTFPLVESIGYKSFADCTNLEAFVLPNSTKMTALDNSNVFDNTPIEKGEGYVYVPLSLIESYNADTNWSTYANKFRAIEDYPNILA
jgi:hypothetical protein